MIKCPKCGAELNFNEKTQKVECEYCRTVFVPKKLMIFTIMMSHLIATFPTNSNIL